VRNIPVLDQTLKCHGDSRNGLKKIYMDILRRKNKTAESNRIVARTAAPHKFL